jgi:hypothetical protein
MLSEEIQGMLHQIFEEVWATGVDPKLDDRFHETDHIGGHRTLLVNQCFAATSSWPNLGRHMIRIMEAPD